MMYIPDPYAIIIYTDGSVPDNPGGIGGIAGIAVFPEHLQREPTTIFTQGYEATTNNRMELRACIKALNWIQAPGANLGAYRIILIPDSTYVEICWHHAPIWQRNRWIKEDGLPVENERLVHELISAKRRALGKTRVDLEQRKGKSDEFSNRVDKLAKQVARSGLYIKDDGFIYAKISPTKVPGGKATEVCTLGTYDKVRIYKKEPYPKRDLVKISFDVFSEKTQTFFLKHHAFADRVTADNIHRQNCYKIKTEMRSSLPTVVEYSLLPKVA